MTSTMLAALARLATAEADAAFDRCDVESGWYCHRLYKRIVEETGNDPLVWHRASEYLTGQDRLTSEVAPPPDPTWADLGV